MQRIIALALLEVRTAWRRPSWWVLLAIIGLLTWGFASGSVTIGSGSAVAGGERTHVNNEFNLAFVDILLFALFYLFFACTQFGNATGEDDSLRVMPIVGSTGLTPREYVIGRWLGIALVFCAVIAVHLALQIAFFQTYPVAEPEKVRGPFVLMNYVRPMAIFVLLPTLSVGAVAFAVGAVTRQAVLVFALPVAILLACVFLLWNFSPEWLPTWANTAMQLADPAGFRWMQETWLKVDRGAAFYNGTPVGLDGVIVGQRAAMAALGVLALGLAALRESRRMRAPFAVAEGDRVRIVADSDRAQAARSAAPRVSAPLAALGMRTAPVGALATALDAFRAEARELRRSPGLWVFVPLIVLQSIGEFWQPGAFDTPVLITAGGFAARSYNTVTLLSAFMVLYYFTESMARDDRARTAAIVDSTPARLGPIIVGRMAACVATVLAAILGAIWAALAVAMVVQAVQTGVVLAPSPLPFLLFWGCMLSVTLFAWMGFIALCWSQFRNRYAVYAAGIGAMILTGWCVTKGWMNWVFNWHLWDGARWTDFGALQLDRWPLAMNRVLWLLLGVLFVQVAVEWSRRRVPDAQGVLSRLRWRDAWRRGRKLLWVCVPAATVAIVLSVAIRQGPGGGPEREAERQYWVGNVLTWRDAPQPTIVAMDLDLELQPAAGTIAVTGSYTLRNETDAPLRQFAMTPNTSFRDLKFTFDGQEWTAESAAKARREHPRGTPVENHAGLWVFTPKEPLAKGADATVAFRYVAAEPAGVRRNPAGASEFILPSGVVLTSFAPTFLPSVGFVDGIGLDAEHTPEPKMPGPDDWKKVTKCAFGTGGHTELHAVLRVPAGWQANMPGTCVRDETKDGIRTLEWRSDHPVMAVNIVAGHLVESKGKAVSIWHLPEHGYNVPAMLDALDGAREWYSKWFWPYPWKELRISEFPALAGYAQGFPSNISFSEAIGFTSKPTPEQDTPFMVTAHESAHQWWGNILPPGDAPGGNILSEGMAHFSTARLLAQLRGERARMAFLREIEFIYGNSRRPDEERPMTQIDGTRRGDGSVTYDRGGWVFWMLMREIGQERMDQALHAFIGKFKDGPDYPLIQDFIETVRPFAPDATAYDAFVDQWILGTVVPEFKVESAVTTAPAADGGAWQTVVSVRNDGTGTVPLTVAVTNGEQRWPKERIARTPEEISAAATQRPEYQDARATKPIHAGETVEFVVESSFKPVKAIVDPDVTVLMLKRKQAESDVRVK